MRISSIKKQICGQAVQGLTTTFVDEGQSFDLVGLGLRMGRFKMARHYQHHYAVTAARLGNGIQVESNWMTDDKELLLHVTEKLVRATGDNECVLPLINHSTLRSTSILHTGSEWSSCVI